MASKLKTHKGFATGLTIGLVFMLSFAVAANHTILENKTVNNSAISYVGRLGVWNLDGSSIGSVSGHDWGGFALYQTKNWTVQVQNIGQDVLNVVWGETGLDSSTWSLTAYYGDNLSEAINLFPPSDLIALNGSSNTPMNTATIWYATSYIDVPHGLPYVPSLGDITVTPKGNLGTGSSYSISDIGVSTFRININGVDGMTNYVFYWSIHVAAGTLPAPPEPFKVSLSPGQIIYVCFELEKIAVTIYPANFQLQIVSII
jgi:hypothetical protein